MLTSQRLYLSLIFLLGIFSRTSLEALVLPIEVKSHRDGVYAGEIHLTHPDKRAKLFNPLMGPIYSLFGGDFYHEATRPNGIKKLEYTNRSGAVHTLKLNPLDTEWVLYLFGHLDRRNLWAAPLGNDTWRVGTIARLQFHLNERGQLEDIHAHIDFDRREAGWSLYPTRRLRRLVAKSQLWREMSEEPRTLGFEAALGVGSDTPILLTTTQRSVPVRILKIDNEGTAWVATQAQWRTVISRGTKRLNVFQVTGDRLLVSNKYSINSLLFDTNEQDEIAILEAEFPYRISESIFEEVFRPAPFWGDFRKAFRQRSGLLRSDQIHCGDVISLFYDW